VQQYKELGMKSIVSVMLLAWIVSGCMGAGAGGVPHDDSPGAVPADAGPKLCHDGTPPPCASRD